MRLNRAFQKLLVASAMLCMAQASWLDEDKLAGKEIIGRQAAAEIIEGVGVSGSLPSPTSSTPGDSIPPKTTTTSTTTTSTTTSAIAQSPGKPPSPTTTSTSQGGPQPTGSFQWTPTSLPESSSVTATPVVSTRIEIVTSTLSDGSKAIVTSIIKTTSTPVISHDDVETTGMTTKTRNTVIGLVVGIGGAVVVGALGLVAWRIWGRKRHDEEHDVLMDYDMSTSPPPPAEKSERGGSAGGAQRTPFQSTLENYHQPNKVNASFNF
ncbi:hypothetical protein E4U43_003965 [Claviceps pusilla]|uniref:Mid2 domain-containing protein n=1 Tax=Claviceps pusilla TaxID=123648 RepID=A0A9P7NFB1_9HYPO|nr:hypothetical protein E4U43_003965 [Claviceps pusilla]